jgi:hypothetical protein
MPYFRFVIRGSWRPPRIDYAGFFTSRTTKASSLAEGRAKVIATLSGEWSEKPPVPNGGEGLTLHVVDGWRIGPWTAFRLASAGHTLFATSEEEADAASVEAQMTKAPRDTAIWCLATAPGKTQSEFSVFD